MVGCQKEELTAGLTGNNQAEMISFACGKPKNVTATWSKSMEGYCKLQLKTTAVIGAQKYQWATHVVYPWGVDPTPYATALTTGIFWQYGVFADPDCFKVYVRAKCASGWGQWYISTTKCPPSNCMYPFGPIEQPDK